jgi:hypothetical protein
MPKFIYEYFEKLFPLFLVLNESTIEQLSGNFVFQLIIAKKEHIILRNQI